MCYICTQITIFQLHFITFFQLHYFIYAHLNDNTYNSNTDSQSPVYRYREADTHKQSGSGCFRLYPRVGIVHQFRCRLRRKPAHGRLQVFPSWHTAQQCRGQAIHRKEHFPAISRAGSFNCPVPACHHEYCQHSPHQWLL